MSNEYITLISSDNHHFIISKPAAFVSNTLKNALNLNFKESETNIIKLNENSLVLNKICEYFYYNLKYKDQEIDVPEFEIPTEMALELLVASDYFDC
ncbi:hypothetical protein WICMUC_000209 [Wickerhamomyces mucosus]|uniref:Elongin-C n=1 Tax=Wickerhamomyces mucosus TaxID=1378264 RepID=A0A9P8PZX6_9ASCO|nr:hypothetical protein WICMUC_000209 [Wickerhamomyces mucosus]